MVGNGWNLWGMMGNGGECWGMVRNDGEIICNCQNYVWNVGEW